MNRLPLCALLALAISCSSDNGNNSTTSGGPIAFTFEEGAELATSDEALSWEIESRDAAMVMFTGAIVNDEQSPFTISHVRTIDAPVFRDQDSELGPEQFVTQIEVVDSDGDVLWEDRVNSLYQILLFLELLLSESSPIALTVDQVFRFIDMQYPTLLEFGLVIPSELGAGDEIVISVKNNDGDFVEAGRFDYQEVMSERVAPSVDVDVTTVADNGDPRDAIDIAILADGYVAAEREKFLLDVEAISERFFDTEPFKSNKEAFNIHAVFVESSESGAGYDCTGNVILDRDCKSAIRETPFETVFVISALADQLNLDLGDTSDRVAMPLQVARVFEAGAAASADEILLLSNTDRTSGFAGLYFSVVTAYDGRRDFPHTAVHELGHSYGILGDEYNIEGDPCLENEPLIPLPANIAASVDGLKWSQWVDDGTALPTPNSQASSVDVGAYEGAYNCDPLYRPAFRCKMNSSTDDFCEVCSEQLTSRMFGTLDPIPDGVTFTSGPNGLVIDVPETEIPRNYTWTLGDDLVSDTGSFTLTNVPEGSIALTLTAEIDSEFVRAPTARMTESKTIWVGR